MIDTPSIFMEGHRGVKLKEENYIMKPGAYEN
jgi:hypothetical protein